MNKPVYRIKKRPGTIRDLVFSIEKRTSQEWTFLFFHSPEEWEEVGIELSEQQARDYVARLLTHGDGSVIYRSDLDEVIEKDLLDK